MSAQNNQIAIVNPAPTVIPFEEKRELAKSIAASGMFGIKTAEQALVLMMICEAEGRHPIEAVRRYHIINGRPSPRADSMQADFQQAGGKIVFHRRDHEACDATFTFGEIEVRVLWDLAKARRAELTSNPTWKKYPEAMLHARCVSEGVRAVHPAIVVGFYSDAENADLPPLQATATVEPRPAPAIEAKAAALSPETEAAMQEFAAVAHGAGYGIGVLDSGKFSPKGTKDAAFAVFRATQDTSNFKEPNWLAPDVWVHAKAALVEKLAAEGTPAPEPAPVEATPAPENLGDLADPFGPDEDGGRLL